jgi:hypothetical protein
VPLGTGKQLDFLNFDNCNRMSLKLKGKTTTYFDSANNTIQIVHFKAAFHRFNPASNGTDPTTGKMTMYSRFIEMYDIEWHVNGTALAEEAASLEGIVAAANGAGLNASYANMTNASAAIAAPAPVTCTSIPANVGYCSGDPTTVVTCSTLSANVGAEVVLSLPGFCIPQ